MMKIGAAMSKASVDLRSEAKLLRWDAILGQLGLVCVDLGDSCALHTTLKLCLVAYLQANWCQKEHASAGHAVHKTLLEESCLWDAQKTLILMSDAKV